MYCPINLKIQKRQIKKNQDAELILPISQGELKKSERF